MKTTSVCHHFFAFSIRYCDAGDLFAEYGVVGVSLVRDSEKQSKGFAFVEVG